MKLFEIISFTPQKSKQHSRGYIHQLQKKTGAKEIGEPASYGKVFDVPSPKRLGQVTKVGISGNFFTKGGAKEVKEDGYLSYIKAVHDFEKSGLQNNYFPRIHDLKIRKAEDETLFYTVQMEKLVPLNSEKVIGNRELIEAVKEKMFHKFGSENFHMLLYSEFGKAISGDFSNIKDPELEDALKIIKNIKDETPGFMVDVHSGNSMWRITGTMPHVVIIDPLA